MILRIIPANSPQRARKPCPNDWPCSTTTEVNPPQPSTKQREKSGLGYRPARRARPSMGGYRVLLLRCHSVGGLPHRRTDFLSRAKSLLTRKFRVAISGTIGSRPFDCAFRDQEIEQTSGSPLVAWHADSVAASFFRLDQETGDAKRHRQVVQPDQGLWVHQADGRR